jgi:hypothetical protein
MSTDSDKIGLLARSTWFLSVFCTGMIVILVTVVIVADWARFWSQIGFGYYILLAIGIIFLVVELRYAKPIQRWLTPYKVLSSLLIILLMPAALVQVGIANFLFLHPWPQSSEVTLLSVSAQLDDFLDEQCIVKALRSTVGVSSVSVSRFPNHPYPGFDFYSAEQVDGLILSGWIRHDRSNEFGIVDLNKVGGTLPIRFEVAHQGDTISDAWGRRTYYLFARVAKHVTEVCGARFHEEQGLQLRCKPENALLCREILGDKTLY